MELSGAQWQSAPIRRFLLSACVICPLIVLAAAALVGLVVGWPAASMVFGMVIGVILGAISETIAGVIYGLIGTTMGVFAGHVIGLAAFGALPPDVSVLLVIAAVGVSCGTVGAIIGVATSRRPAAPLSQMVGGVLSGVLLSTLTFGGATALAHMLLGRLPLQVVANVLLSARPDLLSQAVILLFFGTIAALAYFSVIYWRTRQWQRSALISVLLSLIHSGTLIAAGMQMPPWALAVISGVGAAAGMGVFYAIPYALAGRAAGPWASAIAGAVGGAGCYTLGLAFIGGHSPLPLLLLCGVCILIGLGLHVWLPLLLYPVEIVWNMICYRLDERRGDGESCLLRAHAAFWDEYQYLRFPGLDSHLVLVAEHNQTEGQAAIELLSMGRQRWAAQAAQIELDARWLQRHSEVESMREAHRGLAVGDLAGPASALLRSFNRISQDVDAALAQESAYNQRLALRAVEERLDGLVRELTRSDEPYAVRFSPIAAMWRQGVASAGRRLAEAVEQRQEIDNPYVIGVPLTTDQAIFVGRSDVSARIEQLLLDRRRPPLLLYGQRRMGKTSLLNNLGRLLPSTVIPLFVDLQGPTARASDDAGLLYNLARAVAASAHTQRAIALPALAREQLAGDPFTCFDEWLDLVEQTLGSHMALLMLDEFETLEYGFNTGRFTGELVLGMFRHMIQHRPRFKILLAGSHRIEEMQRWASYLINVQVVQLSYLYPGEARQLIERPTPDFVLCYDPDARERVMALTRCHPFLLQLLCSEVVAVKNEQPAADRRHATLADVEIAAREALHHGSLFFTDIEHNQVDEVGTIILRRLAAHGEGAVAPLAVLADALLEGRVNAALERLLQRDLVEQSGGSYRFQVELVRRWFASLDRLRSGKAAGPPDWPVG